MRVGVEGLGRRGVPQAVAGDPARRAVMAAHEHEISHLEVCPPFRIGRRLAPTYLALELT